MQSYQAYKDSGFTWLGKVPVHWVFNKAKQIFNKVERPIREEDGVITAFRDGVVTLRTNRRTDGFTLSVKEIGYQGIRKGDLVIHEMDGFAGAIGVSDANGKSTPVYTVCTPRKEASTKYYAYLLRMMAHNGFIQSLAKGIRERSTSFSFNIFQDLELPYFPITEQQAIAGFLDCKTAQIGTLIEKKQRQISLLQEQRTALINHAVTKGLDRDAPMKDSGVDWLGKIPSHWEVKKLRRYNVFVQTGPFGSQLHASDYVPNGFPVVNPANMINGIIIPDENKQISDEKRQELSNHILHAGDIVFARRGELGRAVLVTEREVGWLCGTGSILIRFFEGRLRSDYLSHYLQLQISKDYFISESVGSTMDNLNSQILLSMPLIEPPIEEQFRIVDYVNNVREKTYQLIEKISSQIELLQEYRTALISEAVTGKIDVR